MTSRLSMPSLFLRYARPLWPRLLLLFALLMVGSGFQLAGPQLVRYVIDGATSGAALDGLLLASSLFLLIVVANVGLAAAAAQVGDDVGWRATNRLRGDLLRGALVRELSFHEQRTPGELIERTDSDPAVLFRFLSGFVVAVAGNAVVLVGVLVVLYRQQWWLGIGMAVFAAVMLLLLARLRALSVPRYRASREATTAQMAFVGERLSGVDDIKTNAAVNYTMTGFLDVAVPSYWAVRRAGVAAHALGAVGTTMLQLGSVGALAGGVYLYQRGAASVGTVYLIVAYAAMLSRPLTAASGQADELQRAKVAAERVTELLPRAPAADPVGAALPTGALGVEVSEVTFRYGDGPQVLSDVTFQIAPGEVLAVVGRTGAGKSTLARLLFGLDVPAHGSVRIAGRDTHDLTFDAIRSRVGLVTQQVQLLRGKLRDNLTIFDRSAEDDLLLEAIHALSLGAWFERLPHGLDTVIDPRGVDGVGLSGGEAQLVALGRAFLADPGLVILDEASSRLDPLTAEALGAAVDGLLHHRTAIIIAHRLATIRAAGSVLVLDGGRVVEHGRRADLEQDPTSRLVALLNAGAAT